MGRGGEGEEGEGKAGEGRRGGNELCAVINCP